MVRRGSPGGQEVRPTGLMPPSTEGANSAQRHETDPFGGARRLSRIWTGAGVTESPRMCNTKLIHSRCPAALS
jgi:hypothetical protein